MLAWLLFAKVRQKACGHILLGLLEKHWKEKCLERIYLYLAVDLSEKYDRVFNHFTILPHNCISPISFIRRDYFFHLFFLHVLLEKLPSLTSFSSSKKDCNRRHCLHKLTSRDPGFILTWNKMLTKIVLPQTPCLNCYHISCFFPPLSIDISQNSFLIGISTGVCSWKLFLPLRAEESQNWKET